MKWTELHRIEQLDEIKKDSQQHPIIIFKHSTRCSTSHMMLDRFERNWKEEEMKHVKPFFLDLITYRNISNNVATMFGIEHESPQLLLIQNEQVVYETSHLGIDYNQLRTQLQHMLS